MPQVQFEQLPDTARVWVFAASEPLSEDARSRVLDAVDDHLRGWRAHGVPLVSARTLKDDRFLAIGVDEAATGASGCSIDGLFRVLQSLQQSIGNSMISAGRVYWRDGNGSIADGTRQEFRSAASPDTIVFDTTVTTAGDWRSQFEKRARDSWHARLLG